jgi:ribonuclease BN (tRNA processing enzyme)
MGLDAAMKVQVLGSGDAFGSGGRFNTCFAVLREGPGFLIDCGASAMVSIRRHGLDPNRITAIFLTHLHGDHFGGLPFFILDAQLVSRRTSALTIVGPQGLGARLEALMEASFPGSSRARRNFPLEIVEIEPEQPARVAAAGAVARGYAVDHPSGSPSLGLRVDCDGRVIAYTGDTAWTEAIVKIGRRADLLLAEAYGFETKTPFHLDFAALRERLADIGAKKVVLTHMSPDMLSRDRALLAGCEPAADGMVIEIP